VIEKMTEDFEKVIITNNHVIASGKNKRLIIKYQRIDVEEDGELLKINVQYSNEYVVVITTRNLLMKVK